VIVYPLANEAQQRFQRNIFDDIHFPVSVHDIPAKVELAKPDAGAWRIGTATVRPVQLNHPGGAQGFRIEDEDGSSLCYLTDNELNAATAVITTEALARFSADTDLIIHDSQYEVSDMPHKMGWGHSLVDDVLHLAELAQPARLALFHHDPDRTDDALDELGARSKTRLAELAPSVELLVAREGLELELIKR
jgi:phosphoribosyl 1,2-cyclic phosphodiesterase